MRYLFIPIFTLLLLTFGCDKPALTPISEEKYIQLINDNTLPDPDDIKLIDEHGHVITRDSLTILYRQADLQETAYADQQGNILEMRFTPRPPIEMIHINCAAISADLDSIYQVDQQYRSIINPAIDYQNLKYVVSVIEQCGMPHEYSDIRTIFLVLQHNHSIYQKMYIDQLKERSAEGKLPASSVAMMEDRILMNEGLPQIYGTQVTSKDRGTTWILYDLEEPHQVDQRRSQVGLGPLADYLQSFDVTFDVEQIK